MAAVAFERSEWPPSRSISTGAVLFSPNRTAPLRCVNARPPESRILTESPTESDKRDDVSRQSRPPLSLISGHSSLCTHTDSRPSRRKNGHIRRSRPLQLRPQSAALHRREPLGRPAGVQELQAELPQREWSARTRLLCAACET